MNYYDVKFLLNFDDYDYSIIKYIFNNVRSALNWQFDENFNVNLIDEDIEYQIRDVSNLESNEIDKIIDSFFRFNFDDIINVPLYKFLVLKNSNGLKILANISSLIFDYSSINDFYELFDDLNKSYPKKDLDTYYSDVKDYFDSPDFKKDSDYWINYIFNSSNYVNFYNLKDNAYKSQIINVDKYSVLTFIENHDCSLFDFYGSAFSLYLSRINRIDGCLLKTIVPRKKTDSGVFDKSTLLKIDVNNDDSFNNLLNEFSSAFKNDLNHTSVDVENYLDENVSYYSIYDFNDFDENIRVYTGDYSALTLNIYGNSLELVYNSDLFSDVYVEHMAKNIESLINNVLSSPNQAAGNVDILSNEEKALLSGYCKGETIEVEKDRLFCEAFREHALANPDAVAVDDGVNQISYVELEKSSNSIANDLYENHNVGPGSRVALMLHRDYHFPELVLALNKIGAAYIPIDLSFPVNRIEHMLNISEAKHFITTKAIAESLDLNANIIPIEDLNCNNDADVEILSKSEDLFAILFTSGTTGIPKGVMFHNKQFPWFGAAFTDIFNFSYGDVVGSYFSFSFVASLLIFLSLYLGGAVRLFNENEQKNSLLLIKTLKETHMNSLILPPSVGIPIFENEDLNLDYLILAGAKLNELSKKDRHTKLVNFYGTTEVIFAISKIYDLKDIEDDRVPIGRPVANTWNYILDENGNQMPIGVPGEICISSEGITQGYYNYSQSTSKVYVDNPFCDSEINKRMYCTGDIGFYNFEGEIEIIGREDDQLSVRGFRVESKEVLSIIRSFKEISDIYLDVDYDNLIAYYATVDDLDINEVKDALKNELPYYMVPSFFIELEKIPLNINGKIDKSSLRVVTNNENTEITDEVIFCVVDAFKEVLNQDVVLIDDDFVSLGGNSLSAMKLQLLLKEKLDVSLSSNELIDLSTPQDIANHIKFNLNVRSTVDEDKYSFDELCPLPESQLNVYLDESVNDMGTAYNNSFKIDFKENYSAGEIRDALIKLFEAFPILKARVLNDDGVLSFAFDAEPEIIDGSLNDMQSFVKPFEFDKYLSRFLVVDDGATVILCADFHHLIFDGTSLNILLNKLFSILNGEDIDFVDKGPLRQIAFEEIIDSNYMDNAREFFDSMLADKDEVYDLLPSLNGKEDEFELIDTFDIDMEHLSSFLQSHSITYNQFFTSVFAYTLSRFSGSDKVLFNIIENGRGHIDLTESVGMFVKTLPVLMDCKNQEINSYLKYSSNLINSVMKYDLYPFRILASEYDLNSNILFQYSHDLFSEVVNKEDLKYSVDELKHDLNADLAFFILNNGENRLTVRILYSPTYSKSFIKSFTESYKLILNEIIKVDELKDINYTSDSDIELLDIYNQTEHDLVYEDILDAFKDNLLKYPENKLVEHNDVSYTFSEGAYITDAIGKKLIDLGVKTQDKVSFLVPRSELYMFCALGVMSVGGIYVPLDDNLPNERIEFMIKDTDSKVLIVSDETYQRGCDLANDCIILNISDIVNGKIKPLNELDIAYGDLACILYTSGSTGIPKGVKITRKCILNFIESDVIDLDITTEDVYGLFASIGFDVAMAAIFSAVYTGCCLNIIPEDIRLNIKALNNHFVKYGVTHTFITTPVAKLFIQEIESTSLKVLVVGGEKLGEINANRHYKIVDAYGPTEAYVVMSTDIVDKIDSTSVGYVQNNTKAYILDDEKRRVPIGGIGELYLSGYQLADGYLNREKETSHAFMDNPYEENPNYNQLYRTGDMARLLPDKTYGIVGRHDSQVKIRGNRVELSEIEVVIREIDYIDDVTVQTIENNSNSELVAYVVASDEIDELILKNHIQDYVHQHKPEYMVPSFVIILDEIPLNVNGKVDKRALPDVDFTSLHEDYVAPTTEDEKIIVEAFEKVFNHKIGIYDDFVHLGGDSLTAIKLLTYLEDYNITAVDILSLHTPYAIAKNIKKIKLDLDVYTLESGCPLNESQLNVYLDIAVNNKYDAYIIPLFMEIPEKYGVDEIFDALNKIIDIHPILSMRISDEFEVPYLVKGSNPSIIVENNVSDDFIIEFINMPFDLQESLCRFLITNDNDNCKLFAAFNHIIFDGLSANVFKRDMQAILDGESISVDDSFLKVSAFSQQIQNTDEYVNAKNFYESMLIDNEETSTLMESIDSNEQGKLKIDLDLDINLLKSFLDKHGVSENVLFAGSFAYALSRFTGYENASFNLVENGRDRFNNFNSIGMYANTLPILVNCKNQNVASFMENTSSLIYDAMRYNYYPFRLLANEYNINLDILFQFLPEWIGNNEEFDKNNSLNDNENKIITQRDNQIADLIVEVAPSGEEYNLNMTYCDKFSKNFVEHFAKSYKLILQQIINIERLEEIDYITSEDIEILDSYNQTQHPLKHDDILDAFNDNLAKYENNVLVGYEGISYTHGQGAFIANEVAGKLDELGVVKQDYVALFVNRSEWFLLASMGVLSMGGIYVPIDTSYPDERVIFMLEDTKSKAVLVDRNTEQHMKSIIAKNDLDIDVLNVSNIISGDISASKHLNSVEVDDEDIACVLYTSGTTGVPKGVLVTRKAINNFVSWYVDETNFTSSDVYGMHCSYVFDIHTAALYSPVISGGSLYVVPEDIRLDLKALNDYYVEHGCTHTYITSQVGKLFAESGMETTIKLLCFGGMKLGELNAPDSIGPFESYGPSENLAISTSIFANKRMHHSSIGRFISNVKGYVLDKELRRVPLGAVGELYLAGSQLTPGYLNRNEENDNAFFDNPFDDKKGYERIYKTGDMVRFLPDGTLGIVGRRDGQVKVRGNRVELTEVESSIRSMENVEDVTVQIIENNGNNELVAYIVLSERFEGSDLVDCVREHVIKHKPEYMAPSYVVKLDEIPLNVNGKVDKRALPDVVLTSLHADYVAPTTEDEKIIVEAFEKVFNQKIGIHDDFVHLGGDSLTAIRLLSYLGDYNITAVDILRLHTPYEIAKNIRKVEFDLDVYSLQSGCPLNESQLNVYLDMMVNNKDDAYIIPVSMEISKKYEINDIQNAINNILDVHPILSMCISDEFEVPYLVKGSKPSITVESNVDEDYIIEFVNRPFDLNDSLCRFLIIDDNDDYKLFVAFNHIIFDGLSANVFKRDLQDILDGESISVDESFLKVSAFSQQMQNTDEYADAKKFYESMLTDNEETSTLMESIDSDEHGHLKIDLNLDINLLKSFLDSHGVSENVLFTAAFAYTLSRFTGYENASFNLVENGRDRFNNFNSIGMYVNTLPVIVNCKNQDIASFMENMGSLIYDVMRYNYYPFRLLANEYNINSDILFQFMPEWIGGIGQSNDSLNNSENDIITKRNSSIADLVVEVVQFSQNYNLNIMYCGKYSKSFVEHFAESYKLILKQIINVEKLEEITYITHEDIEILDSYNQTRYNFKYNDILDAFNDNLSECEGNVLVGYEDTSYTHGQGAFIANEVANRLDNLSIAKQDYIALFVNRGEWFLLASMGVLSMGGIYVPIETSYPDERIILMLEDTKSKVVIVDRNTEQHMKNIIAENDLNIDVLNVSDIIACGISTSNHLNTIEVNDNDVACVLYTSGTTGVPKGVLVTRKAINNFVSWYVDETNFTSHDVYGMHCSYVFDMHTHALYSPVITGGSLYIVPEDIRLDLKDLNNYFVEHGCTHTYMTSQLGKLFAESGMETTIKLLCFGGMKLGELNAPDSIGPFESYGPSENLAISTSIFANKRIHHSSIGRFISNVKGYVLDKELRRVPLGAVGELYLSGAQLTSGYLNRQEENDKSFFDNPFDDEEGYNHIYGTGDMVRFLPDGTLGIIGRRDGQVKIRGNRVELTEVESTIRSMGNIEDVTVQIIENNGNNELVAYIVLYRGFEGNDLVDCVREYVTKRKPEYMVPSYVVELDEIPLNVNGKVDKSSLPEIDKTSLHAEYVSPRNENEKEIVKAFENALNLEKVGIYDDFIRLGGDSLTAIRLLSDIKSNDVTMADILTFRTPEAIAKNMSDFSFDLDLYTLESGCPLNAAQLNVFADVTIYNKRNAYHIPGYIPISKEYGLEDILNALDELLNVHPILGMRLSERYEINDSDDISNLDMITDLIKIAKKFGIKEIMKLINAYGLKDMGGLYNMIKTTTRLLKGEYPYMENGEKPPISVKSKADKDTIIDFLAENLDIYNNLSKFMIVETEESYYLFYVIHHIIFDAVSAGVFKHDFETLLDGGSVGLDDTFLKASAYTQQIKNTDKFEEASEYYYPILSSIDDVGTLLEDNTSEGYSISTYDLKFDKPAFRSFLNNAGISENVLFTSVFAYALSQFVDGDKVLFTLVENGRDRFNENFIGMTSNVMPLVADCKDQSINSFMENMADTVYGISRHSYYPILLLYQKYNFEVNILFQFVPNWIADDFINVDDIDSGEIMNHVLNSYSDYLTEFFVQIYQNGDDYRLIITNSNKYSNKLIEDFKDTYISILSNIINMDIDSNLNTTLK